MIPCAPKNFKSLLAIFTELAKIDFQKKKTDIFRLSNNYLFCSDTFAKIESHLNLTVDILLLEKINRCSTGIKKMCQVRYPG